MLAVNTLVEWISDKEGIGHTIERILWLDEQTDAVFAIDINAYSMPYIRTISEYEEAVQTGEAVTLERDPFFKVVDENRLTVKAKEIRDKAWEIISDIVNLEPEIYYPKQRGKYVRTAAQKYGTTRKTVFKYLKRYWIRGKAINALLPDYDQCGGRGKEKPATDAKRGRPRKYGDIVGTGVNVNEDIKRVFTVAINKFYYSSAKRSLTLCYELMRKEYFNDGYRMENGIKVPILKPSCETPTFGQFRYWFLQERNIKKEISTRFSPKKYEQEYRPVLGNTSMEAIGPGSVYQIDATVADVYLVSRFNRVHIIGRPVLYIVQDCYSRMVAGIYVGLEGPSWIGAAMALANAVRDKSDYCKEFQIGIGQGEWPCRHLPYAILADRGEMLGSNAESLISNLGIRISNTPPFRADWKPIVERYFKLTNERTKPFLPGAINPDFRERGGRDYRLDAKLDLYEFTQIIIKCILFHNNHYRMNGYSKDGMMVRDEIEPIPRLLWDWGIKNRMGRLRQVDEETVKLNLMPRSDGTVTAKGIKFKGLYYSSKTSMKEQWFVKARSNGSWKVTIAYDPRNMDYIYVCKSATEFEKCYLLEYQAMYRNKTVEEVEYMMEWEKLQQKKATDDVLQAKSDLLAEIEEIVKGAKTQTEKELALSNDSDTSRKKNIRENRRMEKELNRHNEAFELDRQDYSQKTEVIQFNKQEELSADPMELLKRKQKEAFNKNDG